MKNFLRPVAFVFFLQYDVVIIGVGPAGLFASFEFISNSKLKVLVIDKGKDISNRICPSNSHFVRCRKCKPCNILCGLGGAGGLSDGKLNLKSNIGGDLTEFVSKEKAEGLIEKIEKIFLKHGMDGEVYGRNIQDINNTKSNNDIQFIPIPQRHIGSDVLPSIILSFKKTLEQNGVKFLLKTCIDSINKNKLFELSLENKEKIYAKFLLVAPGRSGADWLSNEANRLGIKTQYAPIDIGVRVEVPSSTLASVIKQAWDPKFHIKTKTYKDFVRTFCTCPNGFVVMEDYGDFVCVNGHSMAHKKSNNTNFGFLVNIRLTSPVENTSSYGMSIAKMATTIGGNMPIVQRLKDLREGRRSTNERIAKSSIKPTLHHATPGDIAMALPHRIVTDIIEGLETLDQVIPGICSDSTLLYAPEIKLYSMRFLVNKTLETNMNNLFVAGDGAGLSRGIVTSAATGIIAAQGIISKSLLD